MTNTPITFNPVAKRTYCRNLPNRRETWGEVANRAGSGLANLSGGYIEANEIQNAIYNLEVFPAGRWLWIGGTEWVLQPKNHMAGFNCISLHLTDLEDIRDVFDLCCQGCGVGEVLENVNINSLPPIKNKITVEPMQWDVREIGKQWDATRTTTTRMSFPTDDNDVIVMHVGDSREGWANAIYYLLHFATAETEDYNGVTVLVDLSYVRPQGTRIKGFGGVANPVGLPRMFKRIGEVLNQAHRWQLTDEELAIIIDEGAEAVVAGNVRRSAGMKQFRKGKPNYKERLYTQDEEGNYQVDDKRKALRMSNHTKVHHTLPTLNQVYKSVQNQYATGEGAIQFAPVAVARANCDVLYTPERRAKFMYWYQYDHGKARQYLIECGAKPVENEITHRMSRYGLNPCGEIIGSDFACNLSEVQLVNADPLDLDELQRRFELASYSACAMLELDFPYEKLERSRKLDPIVGVGFTGWFDFCVKAFGEEWLEWCFQGRPHHTPQGEKFLEQESAYLELFNKWVNHAVTRYCDDRNIKRPNRTTTIKPSGTLSQLSGACPGGHPSKASHFIRRVTFSADDPVARACMRAGYRVVPSQRCTDEHGNLLDDPFDPRVDEWLVEMPVKAEWTKYCVKDWDTQELPAVAQFDIAMQLQKHYAEHNVSYTIEYDFEEIYDLSACIHYEMQQGNYVSFAMMQRARAKQLSHTFPRLPYEPISEEDYYDRMHELQLIGEGRPFDSLLTEEYQDATIEQVSDTGDVGCSTEGCTL